MRWPPNSTATAPLALQAIAAGPGPDGRFCRCRVDKNLQDLLRLADRHYIIQRGRVVWAGSGDALRADETARASYLGV